MLSELSAGNKQRMNTMKHELKLKLEEIETQRKRSLEMIDSETKLIYSELAKTKPSTATCSTKPALHLNTDTHLTTGYQILPNKFRQSNTIVARGEQPTFERSYTDIAITNLNLIPESKVSYSHIKDDGRNGSKVYPKGVNQYTNEFRRKVSEFNSSRHHSELGAAGKHMLQTPGLSNYLHVHSSTLNAKRNPRRSSDTSLLSPRTVHSEDGITPNGVEPGIIWPGGDDQFATRAHTTSSISRRKSSSILLPSLDAPSRAYQSRDDRAPKSLNIGRKRSFAADQVQYVPAPPSCRGYSVKNLASLHEVMQRSSIFKAEDLDKEEETI